MNLGGPYGPTDPRGAGNQLGQVRTVTLGQRVLVLDLSQRDAHGWIASADVLTIALTRLDVPSAAQLAALGPATEIDTPIEGIMTYGVGAYSETVSLDWINGTMVCVPAGSVQLVANYPIASTTPAPTGWDQQVGAMVTRGFRGGGAGSLPLARRTVRVGGLNAGVSTARINVPNRSQAVRLLLSDPSLYGNVRMAFCRAPGPAPGFPFAGVPSRVLYQLSPGGADAIPFSDEIRGLVLTNTSGTNLDQVTLVFDLAL